MHGMPLKSPIKGILNPILKLKTESQIEMLVSLTPASILLVVDAGRAESRQLNSGFSPSDWL
jgi:hypothetical protein